MKVRYDHCDIVDEVSPVRSLRRLFGAHLVGTIFLSYYLIIDDTALGHRLVKVSRLRRPNYISSFRTPRYDSMI